MEVSKPIEIRLEPGRTYSHEEVVELVRVSLLTPVRDAVADALDDGADRLALCDFLRDLADELDDVRTEALEHGGTRVIVRGDVSVIYGRGDTFTAYPTPRRIETIFPTIERAVRSIVRLAAARRNP